MVTDLDNSVVIFFLQRLSCTQGIVSWMWVWIWEFRVWRKVLAIIIQPQGFCHEYDEMKNEQIMGLFLFA